MERPGVLHFYDGRRVVSLRTDAALLRAIATITSREFPFSDSADLAEAVGLDPDTVGVLVRQLHGLGLLDASEVPAGSVGLGSEDGRDDPLNDAASLCSAASMGWTNLAQAHERLTAATVFLFGGPTSSTIRAFGDTGLRIRELSRLDDLSDADPETDLLIALPETVDFDDVNRRCLAAGLAWLPLGRFDGAALRVGPLIIAGQSACYSCLVTRLSANVDFWPLYREMLTMPAAPAPPSVRQWADSVATLIAIQWLGGRDPALPGSLHTLTPHDRTTRIAKVLRVPRCDACGAPDYLPAAAPWELPHDD
jgi:bacteriocin biosynthesis cyclodehydratase domain-containing protein